MGIGKGTDRTGETRNYVTGGIEGLKDGLADGFMTGGLFVLGGSVIRGTIKMTKIAKNGLTIGKTGQFEKIAEMTHTEHYSGLKEFRMISRVFGENVARRVGWWQNRTIVNSAMMLKATIYDCGGELTGAYAKEIALTKGYKLLCNIWVM